LGVRYKTKCPEKPEQSLKSAEVKESEINGTEIKGMVIFLQIKGASIFVVVASNFGK